MIIAVTANPFGDDFRAHDFAQRVEQCPLAVEKVLGQRPGVGRQRFDVAAQLVEGLHG